MHPAKLHLLRAFRCDFTRDGATDAERAELAAAPEPVTAPHVQDYLAWRRSMAWVALPPVAVAVVLSLIDWIDEGGGENVTRSMHFLQAMLVGSSIWLLVAVASAARRWREPDLVRRRLRLGWLVSFLTPILVCLVPFSDLVLGENVPARPVEGDQQGALNWFVYQLTRFGFGLYALLWLAPSFLSLFPAITRAGYTVKTLLPRRSTAAAVAGLMAPIYAGGFLIAGAAIQQVGGSFVLAAGLGLFLLGPLVLSRRAFALTEPMSREQAGAAVQAARRRASIFVICGGLLIVIALFGVEILGMPLLGFRNALMGPLEILHKVVLFVASLTVFTVVSADALVEGMLAADRRFKQWSGTEAFVQDGARLEDVARTIRRPATPPPAA